MEQELANILAAQEAEKGKLAQMMANAGAPGVQADQLGLVQIQAATSLDIRKDITSVEKFNGDTGELNHFLRSGDRITLRIAERERTGRLDALDAESLRGALVRRVQRHILNQLQADEATPWAELKRRLQKEYGGGRWTPDEDALRMLRMKRRPGQSKGEFASQLLVAYQGVIDKYRETLTGPEAAMRLQVIESLAMVQLGEAAGKAVTGGLTEAANALVDAAGRGEEEEAEWRRTVKVWPNPPRRAEGRFRRGGEGGRRHREPQRAAERPTGTRRTGKRTEDRRCFSCGKGGHIQARCPNVECYQCGTRGHVARACPYRQPRRPTKDEPMEVNVHRPGRRMRSRTEREAKDEDSCSGDTSDASGTSESGSSITTYAAVVKKKRTTRELRSGNGGDTV